MKQKNLKKKLKGRKPATKSQMVVKYFVEDAEVVYDNLSDDCSLSYEAERELRTLKGKVSQHLLMLLRQQLEPFCDYMQYEMAVNLTIFAYEHIAHTTSCPSVDNVLDGCYLWIADEQGVMVMPKFKE